MIAGHLAPFAIAVLFVVLAFRQSRLRKAAREVARERDLAAERAKTAAIAARAPAPRPAVAARAPAAPPARRLPERTFVGASGEPQAAIVPPIAARVRRRNAKRWSADAVIAAEVLGPPVGIRPGGTLGPPGAF